MYFAEVVLSGRKGRRSAEHFGSWLSKREFPVIVQLSKNGKMKGIETKKAKKKKNKIIYYLVTVSVKNNF